VVKGLGAGVAIGGAGLVVALLLPITVCLSAVAALGGGSGRDSSATEASATATMASDIPAAYLADFQQSGARFGVPWAVLAGIYRLECDFDQSKLAGCNPSGTENSSGAQGPGQFLAPTWRRGLAPGVIIQPGPPTTSVADGYATDGDGDGVADVWDPADAIASTARLLAANGAAQGDIEQAVFAYNHDPTYVSDVMSLATRYEMGASSPPVSTGPVSASTGLGGASPGPGSASAVTAASQVATVVGLATAQLGKPYVWGGAGPASYDCSGLVMVAYAAAGLDLPHNAAAQYQLTADHAVAVSALEPGDLVFFGTSLPTIEHVGIVVGGGEMIDAPHTGAVVRIESYNWDDLVAATRPFG
jgi:cell wall-associated NlpC family hydrolase